MRPLALALAGLALSAGGASGQSQQVEFADWTFVSGEVAGGTLRGAAIQLSGSDLGDNAQQGTIVDGTDTYFAHPNFSPQLPQHDTVALYVNTGHSYTLAFSGTVFNPVLHIGSLASTFTFPAGTQITKLSGQDTFTVSGNSVRGVVAGPVEGQTDANGTVRLNGAFRSSLTFTAEPVYFPVTQPDGIYFQIGAPPPGASQPAPSRPLRLDDLPPLRDRDVGRVANVAPVRGHVLIAVPAGASQKGLRFVPLAEARRIPIGSFLDTRGGTVRLRSATGSRNRSQTGDFSRGLFQVLQARRGRTRGLTDLVLKGASFRSCRRAGRGKRASAAQSIRRRLRANARGRFRTRGRHSAATVRGTAWLTADRCDGTLTRVTRGRVAVRDFRRRKTILLRAGKSYLARAPR